MIFLLLFSFLITAQTRADEESNFLPSLSEEQITKIEQLIKDYPAEDIINNTDHWLPLETPLPLEGTILKAEHLKEFHAKKPVQLSCDRAHNGRIMKKLHAQSVINSLTLNELLYMQQPIYSFGGRAHKTEPSYKVSPAEEQNASECMVRLMTIYDPLGLDYYKKHRLNKYDNVSDIEKDVMHKYHFERMLAETGGMAVDLLVKIADKSTLTLQQKDILNQITASSFYYSYDANMKKEQADFMRDAFIAKLKDNQKVQS